MMRTYLLLRSVPLLVLLPLLVTYGAARIAFETLPARLQGGVTAWLLGVRHGVIRPYGDLPYPSPVSYTDMRLVWCFAYGSGMVMHLRTFIREWRPIYLRLARRNLKSAWSAILGP